MNNFSEGISVTTTTQSPENVSDNEEDEKINLKMENMKITYQFKESQPLLNKGEPVSPMVKKQAKMSKMHPYRNLIFNPSCQKEVLEGHLKKVHSSLVYAVHHLKKPKDLDMESEFVCLGEPKSNFLEIFIIVFWTEFTIENKINNLCTETYRIYSFSSSKPKDTVSRLG